MLDGELGIGEGALAVVWGSDRLKPKGSERRGEDSRAELTREAQSRAAEAQGPQQQHSGSEQRTSYP